MGRTVYTASTKVMPTVVNEIGGKPATISQVRPGPFLRDPLHPSLDHERRSKLETRSSMKAPGRCHTNNVRRR